MFFRNEFIVNHAGAWKEILFSGCHCRMSIDRRFESVNGIRELDLWYQEQKESRMCSFLPWGSGHALGVKRSPELGIIQVRRVLLHDMSLHFNLTPHWHVVSRISYSTSLLEFSLRRFAWWIIDRTICWCNSGRAVTLPPVASSIKNELCRLTRKT